MPIWSRQSVCNKCEVAANDRPLKVIVLVRTLWYDQHHMTEETHHQNHQHSGHTPQQYIDAQRKAGVSDNAIMAQMIQAGWDHADVSNMLSSDVPQPPVPMPAHNYSQTGNTGVPLQVENVQYNMRVKPVESKIGLYVRLTMLGLWLTVIAVCSFLSGLINAIAYEGSDFGPIAVFAISLAAVSVPVLIIANQKRAKEMARDPRLIDDLFYKRRIRHSLVVAVVISALTAFSLLYQILSKLFLHGDVSGSSILSTLVFLLGLGCILAFVWKLHAKTQR